MRHLFPLFVALTAVAPLHAQRTRPPNVVLVLCDDLGQGDPRCYDPASKVPTPSIDLLAAGGMRFTDAHTPSSVCTPTRYGVLTGRYCWRTRLRSGVLANGWARALIEEGRPTLASMLGSRGYRSRAIGKWHLGWNWASTDGSVVDGEHHDAVDYARAVERGPLSLGFEHCWLIPASLDMPPYLWLVDDKALAAPSEHTPGSERRWSGGGGFWRAGPIAPDFDFTAVLPTEAERAEHAILAGARDTTGKPFFLYLALSAPHTPWMPTEEFRGRSEAGWYGDFVAQTDAVLGRVLAALEQNHLADDTLVIFTSDNGSHWPAEQVEQWHHDANNGWRGMKADIWEAGHRVPFVVRWPGVVAPGSVSDQLVCLTDLYATLAAIVGHELAEDEAEDSVSLLGVLDGSAKEPVREAVVHHSIDGTFSIRSGTWKLVQDNLGSGGFTAPQRIKPGDDGVPTSPGGQLYDLAKDPHEQRNLWADQPEVVARLRALLERYRDEKRSR